jgi:hypothetical protein
MPQVKRLKGLKLPVGNETAAGGCGGFRALPHGGDCSAASAFFPFLSFPNASIGNPSPIEPFEDKF